MSFISWWTLNDRIPSKTDCFVILSYAVESRNHPTKPTKAVIALARNIQTQYPRAMFIMSTGDNQKLGIPNSTVMKQWAASIGIAKNKILEEPTSRNTFENLLFSKKIIEKNKFKHVTLLFYDLHARRSLAIAKKSGWNNISWMSATGGGSPAYGIKRFQTFSRGSIFIYEVFAYMYNWMRGEI